MPRDEGYRLGYEPALIRVSHQVRGRGGGSSP